MYILIFTWNYFLQKENVTWYHKGPAALYDARVFIAKFSLPRAARRLADAREELKIPATMRQARLQELQQQSRVGWALRCIFLCFAVVNSFLSPVSGDGMQSGRRHAASLVLRIQSQRSDAGHIFLVSSPLISCRSQFCCDELASCISSGVDSVSFGRFLTVRKS